MAARTRISRLVQPSGAGAALDFFSKVAAYHSHPEREKCTTVFGLNATDLLGNPLQTATFARSIDIKAI
jgi:hypothetical protein